MFIGGEGGGGQGGLIIDIRGVMEKKESPDFRFPEVGISAVVRCTLVYYCRGSRWCSFVYLI